MPPLPPVPLTARFIIWTQLGGGPVAHTRFHMKYTGALSNSDALTLLGTLATSWNTRMGPRTANSNSLIATQVIDLGSRTGVDTVNPVVHAGTGSPPGVSAAVSAIVSGHVSLRYRGGHTRVYIPGIIQSDLTDSNTWSTTAQGLLFTAWTGMLSDLANSPPIGVGSISAVAVHQYSSNPADFTPPLPTTKPPWPIASPVTYPITSWSVNPQVGSQRRRNQQP